MENKLYKKEEIRSFSDPNVQKAYVEMVHSAPELIRKELAVNLEEQLLLNKRIQMVQEFINDLPASDPQYGVCILAIQTDQIELNELKLREMSLQQKIKETK